MPSALASEEVGRDFVFWGGAIDARRLLPFGSPDDVKSHVRRNLAAFMPGGGYVFNNVHNIQAGVPPEKVVGLYDAVYEFTY
jgi:uroporphyrinogen decarboxylase